LNVDLDLLGVAVVRNENKGIKIGFVPGLNAGGKDSWAFTHKYIIQALEKHCGEVFNIGSISLKGDLLAGKILNKASQILLKKRWLYDQNIYIAKRYAQVASQRLAKFPADVIIAPGRGAQMVPFLKTGVPIILMEGAPFALYKYYPQFSNLLKRSLYEANMLQELALKKASFILNPSEWAMRSVIEDYHIEQRKVRVLPYGANIDNPPPLDAILAQRQASCCRLLFVGVDWEGKGGDIAFETLVKLEEMGIQAELIVCGCVPPTSFSHERMRIIPFLDRRDERQYQELQNLFMTANFFLLPTRRDLFGFVFSEASAFGLPAIATDTGGVSAAIKDGENGFLLPLSAGGSEYAKVIARIYRDKQRYAELVRSSRTAFDERLNWDIWAIEVNKIIGEMIEHKKEYSLANFSAPAALRKIFC
jgi:glycosyltransferase involved in cell wall biosynthesis